jgi:3-oxoacyl-[acyl-carrier-protein] synthase III
MMKYNNVYIDSMGYDLPAEVMTTAEIEKKLEPVYKKLGLNMGQFEVMTGIKERRYWPIEHSMQEGASKAALKALKNSNISCQDIEMLNYCGVCRDNMEPSTACAISHNIGLPEDAQIYDISNACLGALNGIIQVANAIELGQIKAGLVVSCESARQIVESTLDKLNKSPDLSTFKKSMATFTGGSGAVAILLTSKKLSATGHKLLGGVVKNKSEHHGLCTWGPSGTGIPVNAQYIMETDAQKVLQHGVVLGKKTYDAMLSELDLGDCGLDKVICHQVGTAHRETILKSLNIDVEKDFSTFSYLANIGSVSLPITAAIASEEGFLKKNDTVGFFGIGSGLNCMMLGIRW